MLIIKHNGSWRTVNNLWVKSNVQDAAPPVTKIRIINYNQSFTIPSDVIQLTVEVYGAGGGGGGLTAEVESGATNYPGTGGPTLSNPNFGTSRAFGLSANSGLGGAVGGIGSVGVGGTFSDEFGWNSVGVAVSGSNGNPGTLGVNGIPGTSTPPTPPLGGTSGDGTTPSGGTGGDNRVIKNTGTLTHYFNNTTDRDTFIDGDGATFVGVSTTAPDGLTCQSTVYGVTSIISGDGITPSKEITVTLNRSAVQSIYVGCQVVISNSLSAYNGTYNVSKVLSDTQFVYTVPNTPSNPNGGSNARVSARIVSLSGKHYLVTWKEPFPNKLYTPIIKDLSSYTAGGLYDPEMSLCHYAYLEKESFRVQFKRRLSYTTYIRNFTVEATWTVGQKNAGGGGGGYTKATMTRQQLIDSGIYIPGSRHLISVGQGGTGGGKDIQGNDLPGVSAGKNGSNGFVKITWVVPPTPISSSWRQVQQQYIKSDGQWKQVV
jgi:hypothetical protein